MTAEPGRRFTPTEPVALVFEPSVETIMLRGVRSEKTVTFPVHTVYEIPCEHGETWRNPDVFGQDALPDEHFEVFYNAVATGLVLIEGEDGDVPDRLVVSGMFVEEPEG